MPATSSVTLILAGLAVAGAISVPAAAQQATRRSDVITPEEIEQVQVEDAYQVVLRLRPEFLQRAGRPRGTARLSGPVLGGATAQGGSAPASKQAADPYAPEFDQGDLGTSAGGTSNEPGGSTSPITSGAAPDRALPRGGGARSSVAVYVGNMLAGGIEELTTLPAASVREIRYLRPSEAQFRFGAQAGGAAAIVVTLKE